MNAIFRDRFRDDATFPATNFLETGFVSPDSQKGSAKLKIETVGQNNHMSVYSLKKRTKLAWIMEPGES